MLDRFRKERPRTIRMVSGHPARPAPLCAPSAPTQHATQSAFLSSSLSLSTISPSSFPDLLAEHIPNTPVVDYLLTHVATLEDEVKKLREERQEELNVREEMESV
ncbi:hypothetical protein BLNAU_3477 [Blattamonas nauphoetae]|uniref:Uncharacterized protein n=1 Tax=Blattamonas nauphoetae TaxID=2049346 RepID=A0ABQ9YD53_9EUKA|nr:hypothetical protein BLNAU_3477 [Blattamonas nauphoetae]